MADIKTSEAEILNAINAYSKYVNPEAKSSVTGATNGDDSFVNMVGQVLQGVQNNVSTAEKSTLLAAAGEMSLEELAINVANAEASLNALIAVRDKIISAYQDIMRMPI